MLELDATYAPALKGMAVGDEVIVITWLHQGRRQVLEVHPRGDLTKPLSGVFITRSPDRPNPVGLHRVKVLEIHSTQIKIGPIEAIDGTPVVDIKPTLSRTDDA
jgi:tRNA-Thr(GGU) m(6)t(6)A37 methyltransferase TsaA